MKPSELLKLSKEERAGRTLQRIVYQKLCQLKVAVRDARRNGHAPLGVLDEMDIQNVIEQLVTVAGIEFRSVQEQADYEPDLPSIESEEIEGKSDEKPLDLPPKIDY